MPPSSVARRQRFETKSRLPELARLVSAEDWTFTRNLIHGPMQEVGREMLYINQRLSKSERKEAESIARALKAGSGRSRRSRPSAGQPARCRRPTAPWQPVSRPTPT